MTYFEPFPNLIVAYYTDGTHEFYGKAARGAKTSESRWQIYKMEYTGDNWIGKYPADPVTGLGTDAPKFKWDDVTTLTYQLLGV